MEISVINAQNGWWKQGERFDEFDPQFQILRQSKIIFNRSMPGLSQGKISVIRGPRQSGKTVLIKQTIEYLIKKQKVNPRAVCYLTCDRFASGSRKELRRALEFLISGARELPLIYVFLDEINYIKEWEYELKSMADLGLISKMCIVATGSSPALLKTKVELLPGRGVNEYYLKPLSFREFVIHLCDKINYVVENKDAILFQNLGKKLNSISVNLEEQGKLADALNEISPFKSELDFLFSVYLITGGFPKAINNYIAHVYEKRVKNLDSEIYEDLMRVILTDIQKHSKKETISKQILNGIMKRITSRYSYTTLSKETEEGITQPTITDYVELFEESFLTKILYSYDFTKKLIRPKADKKVFFTDPFISHSIGAWLSGRNGFELSLEKIENEDILGKIMEGIVGEHLILTKEKPLLVHPDTFLWYFYNGGKEIDFIYKKEDGNYQGIEVKYQHSISDKEISRISNVPEYIVLTRDEMRSFKNVKFVPLVLFLAVLSKSEKNL